jgi:hypothetical protein
MASIATEQSKRFEDLDAEFRKNVGADRTVAQLLNACMREQATEASKDVIKFLWPDGARPGDETAVMLRLMGELCLYRAIEVAVVATQRGVVPKQKEDWFIGWLVRVAPWTKISRKL